MKKLLLLSVLALLAFAYFHKPAPAPAKTAAVEAPRRNTVLVVAATESYSSRWKTGPTAQNEWKTGPNAQTNFEPFAPSEQAKWNQTTGYTIVSGARLRR